MNRSIYYSGKVKEGYLLSLLNTDLFLFTNQLGSETVFLDSEGRFRCLRDCNSVAGYLLAAQQC